MRFLFRLAFIASRDTVIIKVIVTDLYVTILVLLKPIMCTLGGTGIH